MSCYIWRIHSLWFVSNTVEWMCFCLRVMWVHLYIAAFLQAFIFICSVLLCLQCSRGFTHLYESPLWKQETHFKDKKHSQSQRFVRLRHRIWLHMIDVMWIPYDRLLYWSNLSDDEIRCILHPFLFACCCTQYVLQNLQLEWPVKTIARWLSQVNKDCIKALNRGAIEKILNIFPNKLCTSESPALPLLRIWGGI